MGTLVTVYVRADDAATVAAIERNYPSAMTEPGSTFYDLNDASFGWEPPEEQLRALSAQLNTDVLWLAFQSVVDAFKFHHWQRGKCLRSLVFGCRGPEERTWERAEGEAEPWERDAIFDAGELTSLLETASQEEARKYRRIWTTASLAAGQANPAHDSEPVVTSCGRLARAV